jgi:hypothetical protein
VTAIVTSRTTGRRGITAVAKRLAVLPPALALYIGATIIHGGIRAEGDDLSPFAPQDISALDSAWLGGLPTAWMQDALGAEGAFADLAFMLWQSLFSLPLIIAMGVALLYGWRMFVRLLALHMALLLSADVLYAIVPTRPPWMDADVTRIVAQELGVVDRADRNPYAALPSLHVGLPALYALWFARMPGSPRAIAPALALWTAAMSWAVVYAGEHYVADVITGVAWAAIVYFAIERLGLAHVRATSAAVPLPAQPERLPQYAYDDQRRSA